MPFCTQCGAKLEDGAKFCTVCGARQADVAPAPAANDQPAAGMNPERVEARRNAYQYDPTIYDGGKKNASHTAAKKRGGGKIVFIVLAALVVIAALCYLFMGKLGGAPAADSADLGLYTAQKAELMGMSVDVGTMWENGFSIELMKNGKCRVNVDGDKGNAKWSKEENGAFHLKGSGLDCSGTLRDGVLVLDNVMDSGVILTFTKDGVMLPPAEKDKDENKDAGKDQDGTPPADDSMLGTYYAVKGEAMGIEVTVDDIWENGVSIELLEGGKCNFNFNGKVTKSSWTLEGEEFRLTDGSSFHGTLKNGVLTLEDVAGMGVTLYFSKDSAELPPPSVEAGEADYSVWAGEYYGFWTTYQVSGRFAQDGSYEFAYWDVCATIDVDDDRGELYIWDEDGDNLAAAEVSFGPGMTDRGCMTSTSGKFYSNDLSGGVWKIDPGEGMFRNYEGFVVISGRYSESEEDWVDYYIFLRPWGMDWEDVRNGDMSEMIYTDMMPKHYDDWYLPLIRAGKPMPDDFDGLN